MNNSSNAEERFDINSFCFQHSTKQHHALSLVLSSSLTYTPPYSGNQYFISNTHYIVSL